MRKSLSAVASLVVGIALVLVPAQVSQASTEQAGVQALPTCKSFSTFKKTVWGWTLHTNVPTTAHQNRNTNCLLRYGDRGAGVLVLQDALSRCLAPITLDGIYGQETQNAVRFVQGSAGVPVDGIYGPKTRDVMDWPYYDPDEKFVTCAGL